MTLASVLCQSGVTGVFVNLEAAQVVRSLGHIERFNK
jgi:hypothetical protein